MKHRLSDKHGTNINHWSCQLSGKFKKTQKHANDITKDHRDHR